MTTSQRWMLTGGRGVGKTTLCRALAERARLDGWDVAGLLSPAVFEGKIKTGILAENARTGETRPLAGLKTYGSFDLPLGRWFFDRSTLDWGNRVLESSLPCRLLIIDELGPLELTRQEGWQAAFDVLRRGEYEIALVVVRPELQEVARQSLSLSETITIDQTQRIDQGVRFYWPKIKAAALNQCGIT